MPPTFWERITCFTLFFSLSLAFSIVDSFVAGASETQEFLVFNRFLLAKIEFCKENGIKICKLNNQAKYS